MIPSLLGSVLRKNRVDRLLDHPVFIISPPRSGSTLLFDCLCQIDEVYNLSCEADYIWWDLFPYQRTDKASDYVGAEEATSHNIRSLREKLCLDALGVYRRGNISRPNQIRLAIGWGLRYLDKTISNCFHLEFLERAFPDAEYIFLVRDPRATISSMIEGWPFIDRFGKPQLTPALSAIDTPAISHWTYPAPPGWRAIVGRPLPQICSWSWNQHVEYALDFFSQANKKPIEVRYEEMVARPSKVIEELTEKLRLNMNDRIRRFIENPPISNTTISKPQDGKWSGKYLEEIHSVLPLIEHTASRIGYDLRSIA